MKHYIVTGGAGFIGSRLIVELFNGEPCMITCIDNFDPFYSPEIKQLNLKPFKDHPDFKLLSNDIGKTNAQDLRQLINEPVDAIIHLAAKAGVRPSIKNPLAYQQSNVIGLQNILDFAKLMGVKQFVFASSSSVYGINDHYPWKEDEQLMPISPYAMTKLAGEMLGHVYSKLFDIRFVALRFFTAYGPGQRPDLAIHKFTKSILADQPIPMFGDGSTQRDYTYVDDIVKGIIASIKYKNTMFEIINLGNNYSVSLKDLISGIEETIGKKARIENLPMQAGDVPVTFADISKAKRILNYQPSTDLQSGLKKFYEWFEKNREILLPSAEIL